MPSEQVLAKCPSAPLPNAGTAHEFARVYVETAGELKKCGDSKEVVVEALRERNKG